MFERWKQFVSDMNSKGVPLPMVRDGKTGRGSVSLTLLVATFTMWVISIVGKAAGALGGIDPSQTLNMFMVTCGIYYGRKFQKDEKGVISFDEPTKKEE